MLHLAFIAKCPTFEKLHLLVWIKCVEAVQLCLVVAEEEEENEWQQRKRNVWQLTDLPRFPIQTPFLMGCTAWLSLEEKRHCTKTKYKLARRIFCASCTFVQNPSSGLGRQHYRLSICWYLGWVWQKLNKKQIQKKIWCDEQACLELDAAQSWVQPTQSCSGSSAVPDVNLGPRRRTRCTHLQN